VPTPSPTAYGDSLAFLLSQIGARSGQLFTDQLRPLGITPRHFAVLSHIAAGEPKTQQQLADLLGIHRNNMVTLIDEMEAAGWVHRHRGEVDRRVFEIRPSEAGRRVVASINELVTALDEELGAPLDLRQRRQLVAALRLISQSLGLATAVHPAVSGRR